MILTLAYAVKLSSKAQVDYNNSFGSDLIVNKKLTDCQLLLHLNGIDRLLARPQLPQECDAIMFQLMTVI